MAICIFNPQISFILPVVITLYILHIRKHVQRSEIIYPDYGASQWGQVPSKSLMRRQPTLIEPPLPQNVPTSSSHFSQQSGQNEPGAYCVPWPMPLNKMAE